MNKKEKLVLIALACIFVLGVVFSIKDLNVPVLSSQEKQEYEKQSQALKTGPVDINSADSMQLQLLSGIGPAKAESIVEYRKSNGLFSRIEDIMNVPGIGIGTFEQIKERLLITQSIKGDKETIHHQTKINRMDINQVSQTELEKIPGIGPVKAKSIIEYREKNGDFQDLSDLILVKGIGEKTLENMTPMITIGN